MQISTRRADFVLAASAFAVAFAVMLAAMLLWDTYMVEDRAAWDERRIPIKQLSERPIERFLANRTLPGLTRR